ncbi:uncharacterized protein Dmoj_GI10114 [Drosophila mojavensis]|uniref:SprT-like domain-containing protein n=1 Tax=Drosophila mojavensis TaxID=7230 RepID=B4KAI6_DROMO|nr:uncharacterized protein Dmoj_GI10114 [Drosophila mojavensis]
MSPTSGCERVLRSRVKIERQETLGSIAEEEASVLLIYLDLDEPIAIVRSEPAADAAVEADVELKRRVDSFLGCSKALRPLYNPSDTFEDIQENDRVAEEQVKPEPPKLERLLLPRIGLALKSFPSLRQKLFVENVQRLNAAYFEQQTPQQLKEPIDLTYLPDEEQRARLCREHKALVQQIQEQEQEQDQNLLCYDFLSSLSPDTPLAMCHPLALGYRQQSFDDCKAELAKALFGLLNHVVFHCGLHQWIDWLPPRKLHASCALSLESDLQRRARFQLPSHIREAGELVGLLLHEMCHAAAFVYSGEMAHGLNTRKWAYRAKSLLPQLPLVADCAASCRYTCHLCRRSACGDIRFRGKQQLLRCFHCQFELIVSDCSGDSAHEPRLMAQSDTSYMIYIRAHYAQCDQSGHSSKMRTLNAQYSRMQVDSELC